jgi:2-polyprenyl-6-methoxyphenol hydroxylase-like FAD-dependent oxidoreductase
VKTRCCIAGGGPAGIMLGYLLARSGIDVLVLEKHADFFRDFRGDTVHPSTLDVIAELGLLDDFLALPHQEMTEAAGMIGDTLVQIADLSHLPTRCKFIALMPQWDFLNFLAEKGKRYSDFRVLMATEVSGLIEEDGIVTGVRATSPDGPLEIRAELVVGADGRGSTVREAAGLQVRDFGSPIDVLWFRLDKNPGDATETLGHFIGGRLLVMIDRGDYWQCAYVIPKGGIEAIQARGLPALRNELALFIRPPASRLDQLRSWDDIKLLTVTIDRLECWSKPGLLCIGDAAHAMSPMGGVGINLAIQDAVATANILVPILRSRALRPGDLEGDAARSPSASSKACRSSPKTGSSATSPRLRRPRTPRRGSSFRCSCCARFRFCAVSLRSCSVSARGRSTCGRRRFSSRAARRARRRFRPRARRGRRRRFRGSGCRRA